jgi:hypothetical protein
LCLDEEIKIWKVEILLDQVLATATGNKQDGHAVMTPRLEAFMQNLIWSMTCFDDTTCVAPSCTEVIVLPHHAQDAPAACPAASRAEEKFFFIVCSISSHDFKHLTPSSNKNHHKASNKRALCELCALPASTHEQMPAQNCISS